MVLGFVAICIYAENQPQRAPLKTESLAGKYGSFDILPTSDITVQVGILCRNPREYAVALLDAIEKVEGESGKKATWTQFDGLPTTTVFHLEDLKLDK